MIELKEAIGFDSLTIYVFDVYAAEILVIVGDDKKIRGITPNDLFKKVSKHHDMKKKKNKDIDNRKLIDIVVDLIKKYQSGE